MGRIVGLALLVAVAATVAIIALGGVELSPKQQAKQAREAAAPFKVPKDPDPLPPAPKLARVALPAQGRVGATVTLQDLHLRPRRIVVKEGESVRWVNRDSEPHVLLADDQGGAGSAATFKSGKIEPGHSFRATLDRVGTLRYVCTLHPTAMVGYIRVEAR